MDRRKFMLGAGASALAPVVTPAAVAGPVLVGLDFGREAMAVYFVRTRLPAAPWRKFYQGIPIKRVGELIVEDWPRSR